MRAAARAYAHGFGVEPVFLRSGGSVPVVSTFQELLGIPTVLMGFGLPDDAIHAPNEHMQLATWRGRSRRASGFSRSSVLTAPARAHERPTTGASR